MEGFGKKGFLVGDWEEEGEEAPIGGEGFVGEGCDGEGGWRGGGRGGGCGFFCC